MTTTTIVQESPDEPEQPESPADPDTRETPAATETVELQLIEWSGVEELIASYPDRVVVVDLWATYCAPCRKEFPGLVELSGKYPDSVACISVSLDDIGDQEAVMEFLREQNATIDNVLCTTDPDTLYDEILKIGAIPAIFVYGQDGEIRRQFVGPAEDGGDHTYAGHIVPFVEELLNEG
jgi:thiol-disulfide isomerase/thioredoxin